MITLKELNIRNKKVLIRVDFNVPLEKGVIKDPFRLDAVVPTINYCLSQNASIILMSHLGRPTNKDVNLSLYPLLDYLEEKFKVFVHFSDDCVSELAIKTSNDMLGKEIHLLENLRYYKEEVNNDFSFSEKLAKHADVYINDAFGLSHRSHASNSSILQFFKHKAIGLLIENEIKNLTYNVNKETILIIGGAKISTKIKMIDNYLGKVSHILIGGAMAFTFLKSLGYDVGLSLYEDEMLEDAKDLIINSKKMNTKIILPDDFVCSKNFENIDDVMLFNSKHIPDDYMGLDIGPETSIKFNMILSTAKKVIWNGPMGMFEKNSFATGTQSIAYEIKELTNKNNLFSVIGGGDTVRAIKAFTSTVHYSHVSTGGGASLKLLSGDKLEFLTSWDKYESK